MKLTKMEKRIQSDYKAGKYVEVRLSRKDRAELRQAAALTLARLEGGELGIKLIMEIYKGMFFK